MRPPFFAAARVPVLTADEMRAWDAHAIRSLAVPERVLMESAGRAAAAVVQRLHPHGRVGVAAGAGNNGGDALVVARTLASWGREVRLLPVGREIQPDDPLLHGWRLPVLQAGEALAGAAVLVDGVLGTGARGAPRPAAAAAIDAMNGSGVPIVALDGPSGVDFTTGQTMGSAVLAEVTVTFGAPKRGLLAFPGRRHAGRVLAVEIGFPPLETAGAALVTPGWARARLPVRAPDAHKGRTGRVLVLAGRPGMAGAAVLAARGALRAGAGYAVVCSARENRVVLQSALPEALFVPVEGAVAHEAERADAVLAGPGMGTDEDAAEVLRCVLDAAGGKVVLDADALTLLAADPGLRDRLAEPPLLTPHPGEMARLLETDPAAVLDDPFAAAREAADRYRAAVFLKGAPSLVCVAGEPTLMNVAGHSGIATGGMGDTLGGVIAALAAGGATLRDAAGAAAYFAGRAAELAHPGRGLLAGEVADAVPAALAEPLAGEPPLGLPGILLDLPPAY